MSEDWQEIRRHLHNDLHDRNPHRIAHLDAWAAELERLYAIEARAAALGVAQLIATSAAHVQAIAEVLPTSEADDRIAAEVLREIGAEDPGYVLID
jgi:hypothetical protein